MKYTFQQVNDHFIQIQFQFSTNGAGQTVLQLPTWRPGRYEQAYFAQKIAKFNVYSGSQELSYEKVSHSQWEVMTEGVEHVEVTYTFYADQLDAGSTYSDDQQLYVNPVNCAMYIPGRESEPVEVEINTDKSWEIATSLTKVEEQKYKAEDFHEWVDSPFIAAKSLQWISFREADVDFHLVFHGECQLNATKIEADFKQFIKDQVAAMGDFPADEFYFLYQIAPYRLYHGVEHLKSTVIALGPGHQLMSRKRVCQFH